MTQRPILRTLPLVAPLLLALNGAVLPARAATGPVQQPPVVGTTQPEDPLTNTHAPVEATAQQPETAAELPAPQPTTTTEWLEKGRYIAAAADCAACHTADSSKPFAGNIAFKLPIGTLYASNITPDKTAGIGAWTEAQFTRAIREGIRPDGASLYPAMPYPSYARMTDDDMHALYVYVTQGVKPVAQPARANAIAWPLSLRFPLTFWRWLFAPTPQQARTATLERPFATAEQARGAYLVEGPGHCGACHTERGFAMQEKALTAQDGPLYLAGGKAVDGWVPPSLRGERQTGLGAWHASEIATFLQTGRTERGSAFGNMETAVHHGTQYLTEADLSAIAHYLKSLSPAVQQAPAKPDPAATKALRSGGRLTTAQQLYLDNCAACHRSNGAGFPAVFPPLAGNPVVLTQSPESVVHIILEGATVQGTPKAPSDLSMPGFANRLTDAQVATLATFIRTAWGNTAPPVTELAVRHMRKSLTPPTEQTAPATQAAH